MIDVKKFTMAVVSLAVGVLLVLTVLVPVINDSVGSGSGEVLYTNTGDYYYDSVTASTSTTLVFTMVTDSETDSDSPLSFLHMSINGGEAKQILIYETEMPAWTSENSFDFIALPLFTFITSDGKYGVEGIASVGTEDMDAEYVSYGGLMYFRMIQGSLPTLYEMILDEGTITVTLSNGVVTYDFPIGTCPQLNGTYLLGIVGDTTGEYTLTGEWPTVLDSTKFYMADWFGEVAIEREAESGDMSIVLGPAMAVGGYGTIADYSDPSNLSIYDFGGSNVVSVEMNTTPAESGDGVDMNGLDITTTDESVYRLAYFIVPVEITEGGGSSISPTLASMLSVIPLVVVVGLLMGTITMFIRRN